MSFPPLFDAERPYASIAQFANGHVYLLDAQKKEFLSSVERFFAEKAFRDIASPPGEFEERFIKNDLEILKTLMKKYEEQNNASVRYFQLLANVSKVAHLAFSATYQVVIKEEDRLLLWGWIPAEYTVGSKRLFDALKSGAYIELTPRDIKPSTLLALQRLCQAESTPSGNLELSLEAFFELVRFAVEWDVPPLQHLLKRYFIHWTDSRRTEEQIQFQAMLKLSDKETVAAIDKFNSPLGSSPVSTDRLICYSNQDAAQEKGDSPWFITQKPYDSINRFSARCTVLSTSEQNQFFSTVNRFFAQAAIAVLTTDTPPTEIPQEDERMFSRISLPFLLSAMRLRETERLRLIATVIIVSGREFPFLNRQDHVRLVHQSYGHEEMPCRHMTSWVRVESFQSGEHSTQPSRPIKVADLGRLTSHQATAEELIKWFLFATEHAVPEWHKSALDQIKGKLKQPSAPREEMSNLLVKHLGSAPIRALVPTLSDFQPNLKALNESELYALLKLRIANQDKYAIVSTLKEAGVYAQSPAVLRRLMSDASPSEKDGIQAYYHGIICSGDMLLPSLFSKEREKEDIVRVIKNLDTAESSVESFRTCYTFFVKEVTVRNCKDADLEGAREQAVSALEEVFPHFAVIRFMPALLQEFFPAANESVSIALQRMLESSAKSPQLYPPSALSDDEVVLIYTTLRKDRMKQWLTENLPQVNYRGLVQEVDDTYGAESIILLREIDHEVLARDPLHQHVRERTLIRILCGEPENLVKIVDLDITPAEVDWIKDTLSSDDVKMRVQRKLGLTVYKQLLQLLDKIARVSVLADKFEADVALGCYHLVLKALYKRVSILGEKGIYTGVYKVDELGRNYGGDNEGHLVGVAAVLEKPEIKNWLTVNGGVADPLNKYFVERFRAPVLVYADVHSFLEAVKDQLTKEVSDTLRQLLLDLEKDHMRDPAWTPQQWTVVRSCLQTEAAKTHLTHGKLPQSVASLLQQPQQQDSGSYGGVFSGLFGKWKGGNNG